MLSGRRQSKTKRGSALLPKNFFARSCASQLVIMWCCFDLMFELNALSRLPSSNAEVALTFTQTCLGTNALAVFSFHWVPGNGNARNDTVIIQQPRAS